MAEKFRIDDEVIQQFLKDGKRSVSALKNSKLLKSEYAPAVGNTGKLKSRVSGVEGKWKIRRGELVDVLERVVTTIDQVQARFIELEKYFTQEIEGLSSTEGHSTGPIVGSSGEAFSEGAGLTATMGAQPLEADPGSGFDPTGQSFAELEDSFDPGDPEGQASSEPAPEQPSDVADPGVLEGEVETGSDEFRSNTEQLLRSWLYLSGREVPDVFPEDLHGYLEGLNPDPWDIDSSDGQGQEPGQGQPEGGSGVSDTTVTPDPRDEEPETVEDGELPDLENFDAPANALDEMSLPELLPDEDEPKPRRPGSGAPESLSDETRTQAADRDFTESVEPDPDTSTDGGGSGGGGGSTGGGGVPIAPLEAFEDLAPTGGAGPDATGVDAALPPLGSLEAPEGRFPTPDTEHTVDLPDLRVDSTSTIDVPDEDGDTLLPDLGHDDSGVAASSMLSSGAGLGGMRGMGSMRSGTQSGTVRRDRRSKRAQRSETPEGTNETDEALEGEERIQ